MRAVSAILVAACFLCAVLGPVLILPCLGCPSDTASLMTLNVCETSQGVVPAAGEIPCLPGEAFACPPADLFSEPAPVSAGFNLTLFSTEIDRPPQA